MSEESIFSVSQVAKRLGPNVKPHDITNLFCRRQLRDDICPVISGRRLIPESYVPLIEAALRRAGKLERTEAICG